MTTDRTDVMAKREANLRRFLAAVPLAVVASGVAMAWLMPEQSMARLAYNAVLLGNLIVWTIALIAGFAVWAQRGVRLAMLRTRRQRQNVRSAPARGHNARLALE